MKKIFTILTVVVLTTTVSFAQFSAKAGLNMANMVSNIDEIDYGMKLGMNIGGNYAMELSDAMSLDISATYRQSGSKQTSEQSTTDAFGTYKDEYSNVISLNYFDISPSLSFNISDAMALSVGPYLAFALSGKV